MFTFIWLFEFLCYLLNDSINKKSFVFLGDFKIVIVCPPSRLYDKGITGTLKIKFWNYIDGITAISWSANKYNM